MESDRILNNPKEKLFLPESLPTDLAKLVNTLGSTVRVSLLAERGLDQRFSTPVLAPPRSAHFACLCCLNTPDSDHQLIRRKFHE